MVLMIALFLLETKQLACHSCPVTYYTIVKGDVMPISGNCWSSIKVGKVTGGKIELESELIEPKVLTVFVMLSVLVLDM